MIAEVKRLELKSFQLYNTLLRVVSATVEQLRCKTKVVSRGHFKFGLEADPRMPPTQKVAQHIIESKPMQ